MTIVYAKFVGKTKCIVGYMKVADGSAVLPLNSQETWIQRKRPKFWSLSWKPRPTSFPGPFPWLGGGKGSGERGWVSEPCENIDVSNVAYWIHAQLTAEKNSRMRFWTAMLIMTEREVTWAPSTITHEELRQKTDRLRRPLLCMFTEYTVFQMASILAFFVYLQISPYCLVLKLEIPLNEATRANLISTPVQKRMREFFWFKKPRSIHQYSNIGGGGGGEGAKAADYEVRTFANCCNSLPYFLQTQTNRQYCNL